MKESIVVNIGRLNLGQAEFSYFDPIEYIGIKSGQLKFNVSNIEPANEIQLRHRRAFFTLVEQFFFQFPLHVYFFRSGSHNKKKKQGSKKKSAYRQFEALEGQMLRHNIPSVEYYRTDHLKFQFFMALHYHFGCVGYWDYRDYEYCQELVNQAHRLMDLLFGCDGVPYVVRGDESKIKLFVDSLATGGFHFYRHSKVDVNHFTRLLPSLLVPNVEPGTLYSTEAPAAMPSLNKGSAPIQVKQEERLFTFRPEAPVFNPNAVEDQALKLRQGQLSNSSCSTESVSSVELIEDGPNKEERQDRFMDCLKSSDEKSCEQNEAQGAQKDSAVTSLPSDSSSGKMQLTIEKKNVLFEINTFFSPPLQESFIAIQEQLSDLVSDPESSFEDQKDMFLFYFSCVIGSLHHLTDVSDFFYDRGESLDGDSALSCLYMLQQIPCLRDVFPQTRAFQFLLGYKRKEGDLLIPELEGFKSVLQSLLAKPQLDGENIAFLKEIVTSLFLNSDDEFSGATLDPSKQWVQEILTQIDKPNQVRSVIDMCVENLTSLVSQAELGFSAPAEKVGSVPVTEDSFAADSVGAESQMTSTALTLSALEDYNDVEPVDMQAGRLAQFLGVESDIFYKQLLGKFNYHGDNESRADTEATSVATAMFEATAVDHAQLRMEQRQIAPNEVSRLCKSAYQGRAEVTQQKNGRWMISQHNGPLRVIATRDPNNSKEFARGRVVTAFRSSSIFSKPSQKSKRKIRKQRRKKIPNLASISEFPSVQDLHSGGSAQAASASCLSSSPTVSLIDNVRNAFKIKKSPSSVYEQGHARSPSSYQRSLDYDRGYFPELTKSMGSRFTKK